MDPTLDDREYIVINKFRYLTASPARGDVVFRPPTDVEQILRQTRDRDAGRKRLPFATVMCFCVTR